MIPRSSSPGIVAVLDLLLEALIWSPIPLELGLRPLVLVLVPWLSPRRMHQTHLLHVEGRWQGELLSIQLVGMLMCLSQPHNLQMRHLPELFNRKLRFVRRCWIIRL